MASFSNSGGEQVTMSEEELTRLDVFEGYSKENLPNLEATLNGLHFITFRPDKIKFCFIPNQVTNYVVRRITYYMSLRYWKNKYWRLRRHTCPVNCQLKICNLFYDDYSFIITDDNVLSLLKQIHKILTVWCRKQEEFRLSKYQRYIEGSLDEIELDSDDLEFFFDPDRRRQIRKKRERILQRMLPPKQRKP